jgi:hypothetical protein
METLMSKPSRYLREFVTVGVLVMATCLLAACDKDNSTAEQKPTQPTVRTEGTRVVQPRNPKTDNGETQRVVVRDAFGRQTISIDFQDRSTGTILKDASGKTISIEVHRPNGTIVSGSPDASGRAIAEGTLRGPDGALIASRRKTGDITEITYYQADGKAVRLYEKFQDKHTTRKLFSTDGTTLLFEEELQNNLRVALKLYTDGKLTYDEHITTQNPHFGGLIEYAGTVYNLDGKPTHRVALKEGPFDNGGGHPTQIDTLGDDGQTVTATTTLEWNDNAKVALGVLGDQHALIKAKQDFWMIVNRERSRQIPLDSTLSPMLNDNTR